MLAAAPLAPALPLAQPVDHFMVSGSDIFALGHYPGNPIYPGVLTAERLCHLAAHVASEQLRQAGQQAAHQVAKVQQIKRVQYLDAIVPGDAVELVASVKKVSVDGVEISASARVGATVKTRATLLCTPGARALASIGTPTPADPGTAALPYRTLTTVLPHRYPFLLLDCIEDLQPGSWIRARKLVNRASPLFLEQMPASWPLGLAIESVGQAGIALFFLSRAEPEPVDIVLGSISDTVLLRDIPFDSALTVEARIERMLPNGVVFSGTARIGKEAVLHIGSLVAMIDPR